MTDLNLHIHNLSDNQIDDIQFLMNSGYFPSKSAMGRSALLLLVLFVRYLPKTLIKIFPGVFKNES